MKGNEIMACKGARKTAAVEMTAQEN